MTTSAFCFLLLYSAFHVSGILLVWMVVFEIDIFWSVSLAVIRMELSYSVLAVSWGFVRPSFSIYFSSYKSHTSHPTSAVINWSLMAFSSGSNKSLVSGTVLQNGSIWSMSFGECWVCCLRIILCVIGEQLKVLYTTLNLVFNACSEIILSNYCSEVVFTLACDFDAIVFKKHKVFQALPNIGMALDETTGILMLIVKVGLYFYMLNLHCPRLHIFKTTYVI